MEDALNWTLISILSWMSIRFTVYICQANPYWKLFIKSLSLALSLFLITWKNADFFHSICSRLYHAGLTLRAVFVADASRLLVENIIFCHLSRFFVYQKFFFHHRQLILVLTATQRQLINSISDASRNVNFTTMLAWFLNRQRETQCEMERNRLWPHQEVFY